VIWWHTGCMCFWLLILRRLNGSICWALVRSCKTCELLLSPSSGEMSATSQPQDRWLRLLTELTISAQSLVQTFLHHITEIKANFDAPFKRACKLTVAAIKLTLTTGDTAL
jgi:hypothetical protein